MEPVTHALSGAVLVQALPGILRPRWMFVWGALVAASPDLDVFFVSTPLDYIEYHRGITHSLVGSIPMALLAGLLFLGCFGAEQALRKKPCNGQGGGWTFGTASLLAFIILLHHLWLDCTNSYGTQLFLPFSEYRVRLSGLFIVDPLLLLPLAVGLLLRGNKSTIMCGLLIWTLLYPAGAVLTRMGLERHLSAVVPATMLGRTVNNVFLTPDAFAPFHWKMLLDTPDAWLVSGYTVGQPVSPARQTLYTAIAKPPRDVWDALIKDDLSFKVYADFAQYPALEERRLLPDGGLEYVFTDLRFGSTFDWVNTIQSRSDDMADKAFRIMARFNGEGALTAVRFVTVKGAGGDSGWNAPVQP